MRAENGLKMKFYLTKASKIHSNNRKRERMRRREHKSIALEANRDKLINHKWQFEWSPRHKGNLCFGESSAEEEEGERLVN
jgi:hypothetical protein